MIRKAYGINSAGSLSNLKLTGEELSEPAANEVMIEVKAIGFNFAYLLLYRDYTVQHPKAALFQD